MGRVSENLNNACNLDNCPQKKPTCLIGGDFVASGIADNKVCNKVINSDLNSFENAGQFNDTDRHVKNDIHRPSGIKVLSEMPPVPDHRDADYTQHFNIASSINLAKNSPVTALNNFDSQAQKPLFSTVLPVTNSGNVDSIAPATNRTGCQTQHLSEQNAASKGVNVADSRNDASGTEEGFDHCDGASVSDVADRISENKNKAAKPSGNITTANVPPPPGYGKADYSNELKKYIPDTLIPIVNQQGKAPLWLRPLAAIASWFGYYGVGQTNCLSCAASVADTLKQGKLYQAFPTQRGGKPSDFNTLQETIDDGKVSLMDSVVRLASHLANSGDLNIVLTIKRPPSLWRNMFRWVDGHACNIIKAGNNIFLVDGQKKVHTLCNLSADHELSTEQADALIAKLAARITPELKRFVGAVDSTDSACLTLYNVGW